MEKITVEDCTVSTGKNKRPPPPIAPRIGSGVKCVGSGLIFSDLTTITSTGIPAPSPLCEGQTLLKPPPVPPRTHSQQQRPLWMVEWEQRRRSVRGGQTSSSASLASASSKYPGVSDVQDKVASRIKGGPSSSLRYQALSRPDHATKREKASDDDEDTLAPWQKEMRSRKTEQKLAKLKTPDSLSSAL